MSKLDKAQSESIWVIQEARDIVSEFLFLPLGIEPSVTMANAALMVITLLVSLVVFRAVQPVRSVNYRRKQFGAIDYGRNV